MLNSTEKVLSNGKALIWYAENKNPLKEFLNLVQNGLVPNYGYSFIVLGFKKPEKVLLNNLPQAIGVCKGSAELANLFTLFSSKEYLCTVHQINKETINSIQNLNNNKISV